jgi:cytochrome c553
MYIAKCQSCHGVNADKTPYSTSRKLNTLTQEEIETSIKNYSIGDNVTGYEMIMKPYADILNSQKIKEIYEYIQTIKTTESK